MHTNRKRNFTATGILFALFGLLTLLVLKVDVQPIGPNSSTIGLATINQLIWNLTGENIIWYHITDWLGLVGIFTAFGFAVFGLVQLIKRKSLLKVDPDIYILGAFYILVIVCYCFFEINIVNYRPVLMNGYLEASYPSSHTMIICCLMGTAMLQFKSRIINKIVLRIVNTISMAIIIVTVIGRLISGVHWFSDIIGGLLLSGALIMLYYSCVEVVKK
ncbi:MAG: phosphatase PAP2 family protein [Clostridia bacterium]|nr:phosphatase PAP2 family protein [Clostridia bacterium]